MLGKLLVTLGIVFYAVVVPIFELNDSHVFNPNWEAHARLHEVWQLATNCAIGAFSFWLVWFKAMLASRSPASAAKRNARPIGRWRAT